MKSAASSMSQRERGTGIRRRAGSATGSRNDLSSPPPPAASPVRSRANSSSKRTLVAVATTILVTVILAMASPVSVSAFQSISTTQKTPSLQQQQHHQLPQSRLPSSTRGSSPSSPSSPSALLLTSSLNKNGGAGGGGISSNGNGNGNSPASSSPPYPVRIAVMGGGNFGLAMASICARQGYPTTLLVRDEKIANEINTKHQHPRYMQGITLPSRLRATHEPQECLPDATYIVHAVPCQYSRKFLEGVREYIPSNTPVLSVSKGIETTSLGFMADLLKDCLGEDRPYAFLSGPSFAREIVEGVATAVVIASEDLDLAKDLASLISDGRFKCYISTDVIGVEIGGAVKNVIALGAGMCEGLELGTNAMSGLVTRGCNEMRRLGLTFGARPSTIAGLSGVGDTFGTCFGPLSRNRKFGYRLGQGETMEEILESTTEVAEGVDTALAVVRLIEKECKGYRLDLKYPILFGIARILEGKQTPLEGLEALMNMPMQMENFDEGRTRVVASKKRRTGLSNKQETQVEIEDEYEDVIPTEHVAVEANVSE